MEKSGYQLNDSDWKHLLKTENTDGKSRSGLPNQMSPEGLEQLLGGSNGFSNILSGLGLENEILKKCDDSQIVDRITMLNDQLKEVKDELDLVNREIKSFEHDAGIEDKNSSGRKIALNFEEHFADKNIDFETMMEDNNSNQLDINIQKIKDHIHKLEIFE